MRVLVLAAGLGTRLRPLTDKKPKALVEVAGRPMLDYSLYYLQQQAVNEICINVHYLSEQLIEYIHKIKDNFRFTIHIQDESQKLLGSGGAIAKAAGWLFESANTAIMWNPDGLFFPDLSNIKKSHQENVDDGCLLSILLMRHPEVGKKYGAAIVENGRIVRFKRGELTKNAYHNPGCFLLEKEAIDLLPQAGEESDTFKHLWNPLSEQRKLAPIFYDGIYQDLGTLQDLNEAEKAFKAHKFPLFDPLLNQ